MNVWLGNNIQHILLILSQNTSVIGIFYRLKGILPSTTLFTLYNSLVLPHLIYCNIIWSDRNNTSLGIVHIKQKKIVRICTNSHYLAHLPPLFADLNTLTIKDINKLQTVLFMYKIITQESFAWYIFRLRYFVKANTIHGYNTRQSHMQRCQPLLFKKTWTALTKALKSYICPYFCTRSRWWKNLNSG